MDLLGGVYVDIRRGLAVGVDGVYVDSVQVNDHQVLIHLDNQLSRLPHPFKDPRVVDVQLSGLEPSTYEVIVNGHRVSVSGGKGPVNIAMELSG